MCLLGRDVIQRSKSTLWARKRNEQRNRKTRQRRPVLNAQRSVPLDLLYAPLRHATEEHTVGLAQRWPSVAKRSGTSDSCKLNRRDLTS